MTSHLVIDPAAAEAVLGPAISAPADASPIESAAPGEEEGEENIYEVMKQHMKRKQEEADAAFAAKKAQRGRPGPVTPQVQRPAEVRKANDLTDLEGVWSAAREYLGVNARLLESVLGHCTRLVGLTAQPAEAMLQIPRTQQGFTNDRARAKLEEALRAVTDVALRVVVEFVDPPKGTGGAPAGMPGGSGAQAPAQTAQRVPPEVTEEVKKQPVIQELMKRFDASVTHIELLGSGED